MKSSATDKVEGGLKQAKGQVKESVGKATKSRDMQASGTADKAEGKVQSKVGDIKKVFGK
ncbi:MAG: CsbD family protein [Chthoniobacterales bacterium]